MEVVLEVVAFLALPAGLIERWVDVHEPDVALLLAVGGEAGVELIQFRPLGLAGRSARGGHEDDGGVRVVLAQALHVVADAAERGLGRVARVDVVAPAMEDHDARVVRQGDAVHVAEHFGRVRAAEAAVNHRVGLQRLVHVLPHPQGAGAAEEQGVPGRRVGLVLGLEGRDVLGHAQGLFGQRLADRRLGVGLRGRLGAVRGEGG